MSGNTRGKLKEHYEGVHRNFDWVITHLNKCLALIEDQLSLTDEYLQAGDNKEKQEQVLMQYPLYKGTKTLGEGVQELDNLANQLYALLS